MEIIIKVKDADILLRQEDLKGNSEQTDPFQEKQVRLEHEQIGCITDTQLTTGNFFMAHCMFQLNQSIQLIKETEGEVIQLDFALQGESRALTGGKSTSRPFSTGQHNICYLPQSKSRYEYEASDQPLDYSVVVMPKEIYLQMVPPGSDLHRQFDTQIAQRKAGYCCAKNLPITPAMTGLIRDMRTSQRTGSLKRLFLESRITELLMLQLEQIQGAQTVLFPSKKADVLKIHEARELLDACYTNPPTIVELARLVGLNEFSLKRGFKDQLGTTILGYITRKRMEDARRFLLEGDKTISEISYWVGYKNPSHFTVAFKKYFGIRPSVLRTQPGKDLP